MAHAIWGLANIELPHLARGHAGLALPSAYLANICTTKEEAFERVNRCLDLASQAVAERPMSASLFEGFSGIAWVVEHLRRRMLDDVGGDDAGEGEEEDPNTEIDRAILALVRQPGRLLDFDLISGLTGMGVYALERLPAPCARDILAHIVLRLDEQATRTAAGITWLTRPELLPNSSRQRYPEGYYNLGTAHGIPGVIALLAQIVAADIESERAATLLDGAIRWLFAQELNEEHGSAFPWALVPGEPPNRSRLAWCYGDAGVAGTLMTAALATGDARLQAEAARIGRRAALRPPDIAGVVDTGLCHGSAGLALIFQRLYQATGDQVFADVARYWIRDTLDRRRPGQGIAGFFTRVVQPNGTPADQPNPGFLGGAAGTALALHAAATGVEPAWDRVLLLSPICRRPKP